MSSFFAYVPGEWRAEHVGSLLYDCITLYQTVVQLLESILQNNLTAQNMGNVQLIYIYWLSMKYVSFG